MEPRFGFGRELVSQRRGEAESVQCLPHSAVTSNAKAQVPFFSILYQRKLQNHARSPMPTRTSLIPLPYQDGPILTEVLIPPWPRTGLPHRIKVKVWLSEHFRVRARCLEKKVAQGPGGCSLG